VGRDLSDGIAAASSSMMVSRADQVDCDRTFGLTPTVDVAEAPHITEAAARRADQIRAGRLRTIADVEELTGHDANRTAA
jgi:hypothetical protein